jgi:hypothetical protein
MENVKKVILNIDGTTFHLKSMLIGGMMESDPQYPMGAYAGKLEMEEFAMCLLHALRAAIKINVDVHAMSLQESKELITFCLTEAIIREERRLNNPTHEDLDTVLRMTKDNL